MESGSRRWLSFGRVALFFILCAILLASIAPLDRRFSQLPPGLLTGAITSVGTLLLTIAFVRWDGLRLDDVGAAFDRRSPLRFVIGFLIGMLLVALHVLIEGTFGHMRWARSAGPGFGTIAVTLVTYLLLACREELAFHGYPLRRLYSLIGLWGSQLVVALVFAAEHVGGGSTWTQAIVGAGVGSLLYGMAAITTRGLAVPIGLHAAWNLGDWMHGGKGAGGLWNQIIFENYQHRADQAAWGGYVVVILLATLAFWWRRPLLAPAAAACPHAATW
jgi:membrane protease YdiL (CAAX protease family)